MIREKVLSREKVRDTKVEKKVFTYSWIITVIFVNKCGNYALH